MRQSLWWRHCRNIWVWIFFFFFGTVCHPVWAAGAILIPCFMYIFLSFFDRRAGRIPPTRPPWAEARGGSGLEGGAPGRRKTNRTRESRTWIERPLRKKLFTLRRPFRIWATVAVRTQGPLLLTQGRGGALNRPSIRLTPPPPPRPRTPDLLNWKMPREKLKKKEKILTGNS